MIKLAKPSLLRALVCIAAVTVVACVVAGIGLYTAAIVTHNDPLPTGTGEYIRLFVVDITIWGPIALLTVWQISVPVIVAVGLLVACIHVVDPPNSEEGAEGSQRQATHDDRGDQTR